MALRHRRDALLAEAGLTAPQAEILECLWAGQANCLRDLTRLLGTQPATLKVIVDGLERRGLVRRTPDQFDGRVKRLVTTGASLDLQHRVVAIRARAQTQALRNLAPDEVAALGAWLSRITQNLEVADPGIPLWGS